MTAHVYEIQYICAVIFFYYALIVERIYDQYTHNDAILPC